MSEPVQIELKRSYGCSMGCGNPYDYILVDISDGSTLFLCVPCYIKVASDMVTAMTSPEDPMVKAAVDAYALATGETVPGPAGKPYGRNAPAGMGADDMYAEYDSTVTVDELPEEFR